MTLLDEVKAAYKIKQTERAEDERITREFGDALARELAPDYSVYYMEMGRSYVEGQPGFFALIRRVDAASTSLAKCAVRGFVKGLITIDGKAKAGSGFYIYVEDQRGKDDPIYKWVRTMPLDFDRRHLIPYII